MIFLLLGVGLTLIFLEFFLPGTLLAILGGAALLASVILLFTSHPPLWGVLYLFLLPLLVWVTCKIALRQVNRGAFYHGEDQAGYSASSFASELIGKEGSVSTELKPAGHILVEGRSYQALSETGFLSKGERVKIVGGKGSHLIVRGF